MLFFAYRKYLVDCYLDVIVLCKNTILLTSHTILLLTLLLSSFLKHESVIGEWSVKMEAGTSVFLTETCMELEM